MQLVLNSGSAIKCLDNRIMGVDLYKHMSDFTISAYKETNGFKDMDFDVIITVLRAALPIGMTLYQITNKKIGFISAIRQKDLSIEVTYKNVPPFKKPLIVEGWAASGNTINEVARVLGIKEINLFALIASRKAINTIKPANYIVGHLSEEMTPESYIIPPAPYKPRDGGNDLFTNM